MNLIEELMAIPKNTHEDRLAWALSKMVALSYKSHNPAACPDCLRQRSCLYVIDTEYALNVLREHEAIAHGRNPSKDVRTKELMMPKESNLADEVRKFIELWDGWEHGMGRFEPRPPKRVRLQLEKLREFVPASYAIAHETNS